MFSKFHMRLVGTDWLDPLSCDRENQFIVIRSGLGLLTTTCCLEVFFISWLLSPRVMSYVVCSNMAAAAAAAAIAGSRRWVLWSVFLQVFSIDPTKTYPEGTESGERTKKRMTVALVSLTFSRSVGRWCQAPLVRLDCGCTQCHIHSHTWRMEDEKEHTTQDPI